MDEKDQPVEGMVIDRYWVYPVKKNNNTALFFSCTIDTDGIAPFRIGDKARPGEYRIPITYVTKEGYEFDYDGSILVGYNSPT